MVLITKLKIHLSLLTNVYPIQRLPVGERILSHKKIKFQSIQTLWSVAVSATHSAPAIEEDTTRTALDFYWERPHVLSSIIKCDRQHTLPCSTYHHPVNLMFLCYLIRILYCTNFQEVQIIFYNCMHRCIKRWILC